MKKYSMILLCLALLAVVFGSIAQPAGAAGAAHMRISSSAEALYRGDSFTLTVSLSNEEPVSNGGVILSYDSSAFEFIGGSCNVSNAALAEVSAANGGGVFVLQSDAVVSGTIFTIRMRVKDSAPFGSYSISGTPSLSIACSLSGTSVTVACRHSYSAPVRTDDSRHESICADCSDKLTEAHTWDEGTVTKAPTCKETGSQTLTCTGCGASKEEALPVTNDHTYGSWRQHNESSHSHSCTLCGKTDTAAHRWNTGVLLQAATCQTPGSIKQTCMDCGGERVQAVPAAPHTYGTYTDSGEAGHKAACTVCRRELNEAHSYGSSWEHDEQGHFYRCLSCGHEKDRSVHTPGPEATETSDQLCTVCSRILTPKGAHEHSFEAAWSTDKNEHWHVCSGCHEKDSLGTHVYDSGCDTQCNICALERSPSHTPDTRLVSDASGHWYRCTGCGEKLDFSAHTPGEDATITSAQVCTQCGFELAPKLPHEHAFDARGTLHQHRCVCGEVLEATLEDCSICAPFPWWIVCILEGLVFCAVILVLLLRQRRR